MQSNRQRIHRLNDWTIADCPKITKGKTLDRASLQREGRVLNWNAGLISQEVWRLQMRAWANPRPTRVWGNSAPRRTQVWVTLRSRSSASLSNLALHFRRGSEKPYVSLQTRVWATPCFETPASTTSNVRSASSANLCFCCNWPSLLGQLTPHVMGELIPIMEEF